MSLKDGIQRFLDEVDPKISARGMDYYRSGMVERLTSGGGHITAEVSGSEAEPYPVEIGITEDGEVAEWSCGCPYEWGPVCKHVVAALLALQEEGAEERPKDTAKRKAVVQELVEQAGKEQLAALVLERCWEDKGFLVSVLSELEDSGELELDSIKELVRESIRANTCQGYIDEKGCGNICACLDGVLDKARRRIQRGQWGQALEIARFILLTGIKLAERADDGFGLLIWTVEAALETIELAASGLAESGGDREEWTARLLETAQEPIFDHWTDQRYALLCRTAVLADSRNEREFYDTLERLSDRRWEAFKDAPRYNNQDKLVRYHIIRCAHGTQEARAYLKRYLAVDEFRLMLAREYMKEGDYAAAESLCRERIEEAPQEKPWRRPNQWQYLLYEIYQDWGQREKQVQQARRLALMGDKDFYQITKKMLAGDGRWEEEYPRFLAELKAERPAREYMELLAQEKETALLMEYVRYYRDEVFRYGSLLAPEYGGEICGMCAAAIREVSKRLQSRKDYKRICGLLQLLANFGGTAETLELIGELRRTYPRRPALLDELGRLERRMAKKARDT